MSNAKRKSRAVVRKAAEKRAVAQQRLHELGQIKPDGQTSSFGMQRGIAEWDVDFHSLEIGAEIKSGSTSDIDRAAQEALASGTKSRMRIVRDLRRKPDEGPSPYEAVPSTTVQRQMRLTETSTGVRVRQSDVKRRLNQDLIATDLLVDLIEGERGLRGLARRSEQSSLPRRRFEHRGLLRDLGIFGGIEAASSGLVAPGIGLLAISESNPGLDVIGVSAATLGAIAAISGTAVFGVRRAQDFFNDRWHNYRYLVTETASLIIQNNGLPLANSERPFKDLGDRTLEKALDRVIFLRRETAAQVAGRDNFELSIAVETASTALWREVKNLDKSELSHSRIDNFSSLEI